MKINLTPDIYQKLLDAGFKEGEQLDVKKPPKTKGDAAVAKGTRPGEHPPPPPNP